MSFAMDDVAARYDRNDDPPDECPDCHEDLASGWAYCPGCGDPIDSMDNPNTDYLCSCSDARIQYTDGRGRKEKAECPECGAIWNDISEGEPDSWNDAKVMSAYKAYLKRNFDFDLPEKVSA